MISSKSIYLIAGIRLDSPLDYYAFGNILSACETINYKNRWQERARAVVIFSCKKEEANFSCERVNCSTERGALFAKWVQCHGTTFIKEEVTTKKMPSPKLLRTLLDGRTLKVTIIIFII